MYKSKSHTGFILETSGALYLLNLSSNQYTILFALIVKKNVDRALKLLSKTIKAYYHLQIKQKQNL